MDEINYGDLNRFYEANLNHADRPQITVENWDAMIARIDNLETWLQALLHKEKR